MTDPARHPPESFDADSTLQLLERANGGDTAALDVLFARYLKPLQHWASGRLPSWARAAADTHDLVQDTLLNAFRRIGSFRPERVGAFLAYLRQAVMNRIRDELRRTGARPVTSPFDGTEPDHGASPLDRAISLETFERYEAALAKLSADDQEAIIGRVELGHTYDELARMLGKPSPDAARMAVTRALVRFAEELKRGSAR
jgi:RNA polymerase sigma-70 factor (ECF subfamily)